MSVLPVAWNVPSFPPRRSSDLRFPAAFRERPHQAAHRPRVPLRRAAGEGEHAVDERPDADRKSTRLNSSHTVISYAVFCLKKKSIVQTTHRLAGFRVAHYGAMS